MKTKKENYKSKQFLDSRLYLAPRFILLNVDRVEW